MDNQTNKPSNADPNDMVHRLLGGEEDVSKDTNLEKSSEAPKGSESLEELKKATGREFKTKDEYIKHIQNLEKFAGDTALTELRKKASEYDKLVEDSKVITGESEKTNHKTNEPDELAKLRERFDESEFLRKSPEAEKVISTVKAIAKAEGLSYQEAYDNHVKELFQAKLESEKAKEKEQNISIGSKQRISSDKATKIADAAKRVIEKPTEANQEELVKTFFAE